MRLYNYYLDYGWIFLVFLLNHLPDDCKEKFLDITMELFTACQEAGFGKKRRRRPTPQQDDEQQANVTKILKIVNCISTTVHPRSSRTAYYGTSVVIGALTLELLQFPKLAKIYYTVLSSLFKTHTDKLPLIPEVLYNGLLESIETALIHPDFEIYSLKCALDSVVSMLAYYLSVKNNEGKEVFGIQRRALIVPFVNKILEFLMSGDVFHTAVIEPTATAFFALICFDVPTYQKAVQKLILDQTGDLQRQASQAFTALLNGVDAKFDQANCLHFLANFKIFLMVYRGIVKKK